MEIVSAQELPNHLRYFHKTGTNWRWPENKNHNSTYILTELFPLEIVSAQ